jgi:glycosyltransferase involved in cell wall biosynthesis
VSRILIHSNAPWVPSGYGKQTQYLVRILQEAGHEVVVSAFSGLTGAPIEWQGTTVLPAGMFEYGIDVLIPHMDAVEPDLTIALMDVWKLGPIADALNGRNIAAWVPADCSPLSRLDEAFLKTANVTPIAMSRFGETQMINAGLSPLYAPHVVDRDVFRPLEEDEREKYREGMGLAGKFLIGMCSANNDATRKAFPEQFEAFRAFHRKHPDSCLLVHAIAKSPRGHDLDRLAQEIGIPVGAVRVTDAYPQISGAFDDSLMRDWYGVLDVLSCCSYAEAFGVPIIEAQACGTPVVSTKGSAMREVSGGGWGVEGDRYWNPVHGAWWDRPRTDAIARAYGKAKDAPGRRTAARTFSERYGLQAGAEAWRKIVETLCG